MKHILTFRIIMYSLKLKRTPVLQVESENMISAHGTSCKFEMQCEKYLTKSSKNSHALRPSVKTPNRVSNAQYQLWLALQ